MNPVTSNLISASAGTGKTYKLASRFISLLALGYPPERLIALTFTRNAAGEFKSNILKALAKGASSPEDAEALTKRIVATLNGDQEGDVPLCPYGADIARLELGQAKYRELLRELIRKLARLNLSTLDSFFSKLVGTNCLKLGYPSVEQLDEAMEEKARKAALNALLLHTTDDNEDGLIELFRDVSGEAKNAFITLEENIYSYLDAYKQTESNADLVWGALEPFDFNNESALSLTKAGYSLPVSEVKDELARILKEREERIADLLNAIEDDGVIFNNKNAHRYIVSACRNLVQKLQKGEGELTAGTLKWLYADTSTCADEAELRRLVQETRDIALPVTAALKTRAILRLLRLYDQRYTEDVRASGKLVFADIPRLVAEKLLNENDLASPNNIAYRLDGQLDHWMLDEFQDTSPEQWRALKALLQEIRDEAQQDPEHLCAERSIFVVGDEKQSIYGFRGATPELFNYLSHGKDGWNMLQCTRQDKSYRSADAIMGIAREENGIHYGFVNDLFTHIPTLTKDERKEFIHHNIAPDNKDKVGYAVVEKFCDSEDEDESMLEAMCARMACILTDEVDFLHRKLTAAILVRSNNEVHDICRWFRKNCPEIPVVSLTDEKLSVSSLLGEWFLHFFKWMLHPDSTFSESMLLHSPLCIRETPAESITHAWNRWRQMLETKGYTAVMKALAGSSARVLRDRAFREWMNEARSFDAMGGTLDMWALHMSNLTNKATAPENCVHVMTFHKSKGLGYDVVLMPFSSAKSAVSSKACYYTEVTRNKDHEEIIGLLTPPAAKDAGIEASPYCQLTMKRQREEVLEALNMLYVAVTRAKLANYIFVNGKQKKTAKEPTDLSLSLSEMICFAFEDRLADSHKTEWGNPEWATYAHPKEDASTENAEIPKPTRTYRRRVSPSKIDEAHAAKDVTIPAAYDRPIPDSDEPEIDAAEFGTAVHALFEQVEWLRDEPRWMQHPESPQEQLVAASLHTPEIRNLYTQQPGQVAYNEQAIDAIEQRKGRDGIEREVWVSGTLDRLVLTYSENRVISADIIDFKTDLRRGSTPAEQDANLCATHSAQMKAYHSLIMRAFDLPASAVRVLLISCPRDSAPPRLVPWHAPSKK